MLLFAHVLTHICARICAKMATIWWQQISVWTRKWNQFPIGGSHCAVTNWIEHTVKTRPVIYQRRNCSFFHSLICFLQLYFIVFIWGVKCKNSITNTTDSQNVTRYFIILPRYILWVHCETDKHWAPGCSVKRWYKAPLK